MNGKYHLNDIEVLLNIFFNYGMYFKFSAKTKTEMIIPLFFSTSKRNRPEIFLLF